MTATDHLASSQFVEPIREHEARGNSRPVSHGEFQSLAAQGREHLDQLARSGQSTAGLERHWDSVKADAYEATREPWGGRTINNRGRSVHPNANAYAVTVRQPQHQDRRISVPLNAPREHFDAAMDRAKLQYSEQLGMKGHHLGVFHDVDEGRIDIDPVLVVNSRQRVDQIGAYTHAVGGAYHFRSGNGYFPPHVKD